ncbi:MAG: hypothetical protein COA58_06995 [Bacteroidetes bacterium]|nr:MAG: hypothetical protein COA58_06995 [Bacteroidota bacterium]
MVNYYKILDLDNYASVEEVKTAYKAKIKIYHPDINKDPDAEEMSKYFNLAKTHLDTQEKKNQYDRELKFAYLIEINRLKSAPKRNYFDKLSRRERSEKLEERRKIQIKEKYERSLESMPLYIRVSGIILLMIWGLQIIFTHHFKQFGAADYFYTILGYLTFATGAAVAANEAYTYFLVKSIKKPVRFNFEKKIGTFLVVGFILSIFLVEGLSVFRGQYLLNNHFAYTVGFVDAESSNGFTVVVDYTVDGKDYKKGMNGDEWEIVKLSGRRTVVKYAIDNPIISKLVNYDERYISPH